MRCSSITISRSSDLLLIVMSLLLFSRLLHFYTSRAHYAWRCTRNLWVKSLSIGLLSKTIELNAKSDSLGYRYIMYKTVKSESECIIHVHHIMYKTVESESECIIHVHHRWTLIFECPGVPAGGSDLRSTFQLAPPPRYNKHKVNQLSWWLSLHT